MQLSRKSVLQTVSISILRRCERNRKGTTALGLVTEKSSETSLMPEYQLFHNLSGQGIMSLNDYYKIFKSSKLKLENKIFFDNINFKGKNAPSAAIFFLK